MKAKKIWITIAVLCFTSVAVFGGIYYYISSTVKKYDSVFYPTVKVESVNLTEKTKKEARVELETVANKLDQTKVVVKVNKKEYKTNLRKLGVTYNTEEVLSTAFQYGKNAELLDRFNTIRKPIEKNYEIEYKIDDKLLNDFVKRIDKDQKNPPKNATIRIINGQSIITDDVMGYKLNKKYVLEQLKKALDGKNTEEIVIKGKLSEVTADVTKEDLNTVTTKIGSFSTNYSQNDPGRNKNIEISTDYIDSFLLMPGESFSFNNHVGDTTADKGYELAGSYLDGQIVASYGGGICQVSTTLYNAIITAGIRPDIRLNHSMTVGYVPIGHDAVIAYGYKDLKFTNPYDSPVYIEGIAGGGKVTFNVYSSKDSKPSNTTYNLSSEVLETIKPQTVEEKNSKLAPGTKRVIKPGANGYKSVTYLETRVNGKLTKKEVISRDTYAPKNQLVEVGPKKTTTASN